MTTDYTPPFIREWLETVPTMSIDDPVLNPRTTAIFSADMINGFVHFGALASPRVGALAVPVRELFQLARNHGIERFVLLQDTHTEDNPEFASYPPHCLADTEESQTIPELADLPFAGMFTVIEKNALNPAIGTSFNGWLDMNQDISSAIVVGDCTDLCTYQLAMHLRMRANALGIQGFEVIVPINAVDTFDIPESPDTAPGGAHPGDFFHHVFLYHMAQNGIRIVDRIA